jgi:GDP-L-fucose synthase
MYPLREKLVWVAGHGGMVGSALVRRLAREGCEVLTADRRAPDLTRQAEVEAWMAAERPQAVVLAAARVGGILANASQPADFLRDNLLIQANVVAAAHAAGVEKLLLIGSSAVYPRLAPQPMAEDALLTGPLEPTHEAYAIAKIAGIKLVQAYRRQHGADFIAALPTNLYGPNDRFDLQGGHVVPSLIRRAHESKLAGARSMTLWGTGAARREFLHVDDCADALVLLLKAYSDEAPINVGSGEDVTIAELAQTVAEATGYRGGLDWDASKPDGPARKLMDSGRLRALGWAPRIGLREGIEATYRWFLEHGPAGR